LEVQKNINIIFIAALIRKFLCNR